MLDSEPHITITLPIHRYNALVKAAEDQQVALRAACAELAEKIGSAMHTQLRDPHATISAVLKAYSRGESLPPFAL